MLFSGPIPLAPGEFCQGEQRDERRTGTHRCYVGGGELGLCLSSKKQQPPSPASCLILTARDLQRGGPIPGLLRGAHRHHLVGNSGFQTPTEMTLSTASFSCFLYRNKFDPNAVLKLLLQQIYFCCHAFYLGVVKKYLHYMEGDL
jgi:hypothetical protein